MASSIIDRMIITPTIFPPPESEQKHHVENCSPRSNPSGHDIEALTEGKATGTPYDWSHRQVPHLSFELGSFDLPGDRPGTEWSAARGSEDYGPWPESTDVDKKQIQEIVKQLEWDGRGDRCDHNCALHVAQLHRELVFLIGE